MKNHQTTFGHKERSVSRFVKSLSLLPSMRLVAQMERFSDGNPRLLTEGLGASIHLKVPSHLLCEEDEEMVNIQNG
jgi:hypothetical protein